EGRLSFASVAKEPPFQIDRPVLFSLFDFTFLAGDFCFYLRRNLWLTIRMDLLFECQFVALLLLVGFSHSTTGQDNGETCVSKFEKGKDNFVLDTDDSVKEGATFISSPKVVRLKDCLVSCCKDPKCNVALMERGAEEGTISSCFLFDCLYKRKYVCRFVRKSGYFNYILDSVYENYAELNVPP
ncbi:hypothetical protein XENOCAPTIV_004247, partial [Xenoophorus captivus]